MNLYDLHTNPDVLKYRDKAHSQVPSVLWSRYKNGELSKEDMQAPPIKALFANEKTDPLLMVKYAIDILPKTGRFKVAEKHIAKNPLAALRYARSIVRNKWPIGENAIASTAETAYEYARHVLYKPFPLGENAIAKDLDLSLKYALFVLKGRFKLGEPVIAKNAFSACEYADAILKGRFRAAEDTIRKSPAHWNNYKRQFGIEE